MAQSTTLYAVAPSGSMYWHGIDLHWAYAQLLQHIHRNTRCMHRAKDVLHDSLIRLALMNARTPLRQPHSYLYKIVRHVLVDQFHEQARWVELAEPSAEDGIAPASMQADWAPSAEELAELNQRLNAAQRLIDGLPPRCREVFWLFRIEGYDRRAVAAKMGIGLQMVERHMTRALTEIMAARQDLLM